MANMKDLALRIAERQNSHNNISELIGTNSSNIASNVARLENIDEQITSLNNLIGKFRTLKSYTGVEELNVGDVVEKNGVFKVIKEIPKNSNIEVTNTEYFVNITELRNLDELKATIAELESLRDMTKLIKFDTLELGGNSYPLVMKRSNLFFSMYTNYSTGYSPGTTPYYRYYFRIYTDKGMLVPKNPSQTGYLVLTADKSKYNTQTFSSLEDAKSKMEKTDLLVKLSTSAPWNWWNVHFNTDKGFMVYMGGQSTHTSDFHFQLVDTKSDSFISRLEIVRYETYSSITPKFKLLVSENADMSDSKTVFDVTPAMNTVYYYDNE